MIDDVSTLFLIFQEFDSRAVVAGKLLPVVKKLLPVVKKRLPVAQRRLPVGEKRLPLAEGRSGHEKS